MATTPRSEWLVQQLIACQGTLYAFIASLVTDDSLADDVLQETNLVLWKKADQFTSGEDPGAFRAWAMQVAKYQVLSAAQKRGREKLRFNDELIETIADDAAAVSDFADARRQALRACLREMPDRQREMLERRYEPGASAADVALALGRPVNAIYKALYRARQALIDCIKRRLNSEP